MRLFLSYLKRNIRLLGMLLLCGALFLAVLGLYRAPLEGALYGLLLCFALGICFLIVGFLQYRKKHRALERALSQLREGLPPFLTVGAVNVKTELVLRCSKCIS